MDGGFVRDVVGTSGPRRALDQLAADDEILPGVEWGCPSQVFSPAYWSSRAQAFLAQAKYGRFKTGQNLLEEYVHCLLGGYGMPAEVGWAAADCFLKSGLADKNPSALEIEEVLRQPLAVGGRLVRYRFPSQKAKGLEAGVRALRDFDDGPLADRELRARLMQLPGVGPKTASWVVRNYRGSDEVAIVDIHIARACRAAGLTSARLTPSNDYFAIEDRFLQFASALGVPASYLDHLMWNMMRKIGGLLAA